VGKRLLRRGVFILNHGEVRLGSGGPSAVHAYIFAPNPIPARHRPSSETRRCLESIYFLVDTRRVVCRRMIHTNLHAFAFTKYLFSPSFSPPYCDSCLILSTIAEKKQPRQCVLRGSEKAATRKILRTLRVEALMGDLLPQPARTFHPTSVSSTHKQNTRRATHLRGSCPCSRSAG
jgi:hypothetical protein